MSDTPELRPCPFCGSPAGRMGSYDLDPPIFWVDCGAAVPAIERECIAGPMRHTPEDAAEAWNTRAADAEVSRLRAALAERDEVIRRAVELGQRYRDTAVLYALGFDMLHTKWRYGYGGWERQAEDAQAGYFPAIDWIDKFVTGAALAGGGDGE